MTSRINSNRHCIVPLCPSNNTIFPNKRFFLVPFKPKRRRQWLKIVKREQYYSQKSSVFCCEDHFNLEEDAKNYIRFKVMKEVGQDVALKLKPTAYPRFFACQSESEPRELMNIDEESEDEDQMKNLDVGTIIPSTSIGSPCLVFPKVTTEPSLILPKGNLFFMKQGNSSEEMLPSSQENKTVLGNLESTENTINFESIKTEIPDFEETTNTVSETEQHEEVKIKTEIQELQETIETPEESIWFLQKKIEKLQNELETFKQRFSFQQICRNNKAISLYTGLPNAEIFLKLLALFENITIIYHQPWNRNEEVHETDQLLICLMKLKLNLDNEDLAFRFNIHSSTVSNIVNTWICELSKRFSSPNKVDRNEDNVSSLWNSKIILNSNKVITVGSKQYFSVQKAIVKHNKQSEVWKFYVGVGQNGIITFISDLWLNVQSEDEIIDDKELHLITDNNNAKMSQGVRVIIPPSLLSSDCTSESIEEIDCVDIAIPYVKRAIRRMKNFRILEFIPKTNKYHTQNILRAVSGLCNLQHTENNINSLILNM